MDKEKQTLAGLYEDKQILSLIIEVFHILYLCSFGLKLVKIIRTT